MGLMDGASLSATLPCNMKLRAAPFLLATSLMAMASASAQTGPAGVSSIRLTDSRREASTVRGTVHAVRRAGGVFVVEVRAASGPDGTFSVSASARADVPLAVGDEIEARIDCTSPGWHLVCNGVVLDRTGAVLFAASGSGEEALAPGWRLVGDGPAVRGVGRVEQPLVLEHTVSGQPPVRVTTVPGGWTTVTAPDGEWLVSGSFSHTVYASPTDPRVPDAVDYRSYAITRRRGP